MAGILLSLAKCLAFDHQARAIRCRIEQEGVSSATNQGHWTCQCEKKQSEWDFQSSETYKARLNSDVWDKRKILEHPKIQPNSWLKSYNCI